MIFSYINYKPVGSLILAFNAYIVEGLILIAQYIKDMPYEYKIMSIDKFITSKETEVYSQEIATYYALVYDVLDWLRFVYEDVDLFRESIVTELRRFIRDTIPSKGGYRLDV